MKTQKTHFIRLFVIATLAFSTLSRPDANAAVTVQIGNNFTASTLFVDGLSYAPNTDGAVGPSHFVEFINRVFSVYNKTNGANVFSTDNVSFWGSAGVDLTGHGAAQTRIVYDKQSQRWFACEIDYNLNDTTNISPNRFLLAVSATTDPTGAWQGVAFLGDASGNNVQNPNLGLDANGVYITALVYDPSGYFVGTTAFSIPKADLLQPIPSIGNLTGFGLTTEGSILQPVINFSPTNGPETFLEADYYSASVLTTLQVSNAATPAASLGTPTTTAVAAYTWPNNPPQPDGTNTLDSGTAEFNSSVYQVGNVIYAAHAIQSSTRSVIRWYRINAADNTILQSGTITDPTLSLFYPSIAANDLGYVVIGFNGCSSGSFVSSYAVAGQTINGTTTFGSKILLKAGVANYELIDSSGYNEWGPYSTTSVDPLNQNHFWTIQEYVSAANVWSTQVTELRLSEVLPTLQIKLTGNNAVLSWPTTATGFSLQSTTTLGSGNWASVTTSPSIIGSQFVVTNSTVGATKAYRLIR